MKTVKNAVDRKAVKDCTPFLARNLGGVRRLHSVVGVIHEAGCPALFLTFDAVDGSEIPNNRRLDVQNPCKDWDQSTSVFSNYLRAGLPSFSCLFWVGSENFSSQSPCFTVHVLPNSYHCQKLLSEIPKRLFLLDFLRVWRRPGRVRCLPRLG